MFSWNTLLVLAEELAQRSDEASKRSAISRAYYCAFNIARKLVESQGVPIPEEARAHTTVWNTLKRSGRARARIGSHGIHLRRLRCMADYDDSVANINKMTSDAMQMSRDIVALLDTEMRRTGT